MAKTISQAGEAADGTQLWGESLFAPRPSYILAFVPLMVSVNNEQIHISQQCCASRKAAAGGKGPRCGCMILLCMHSGAVASPSALPRCRSHTGSGSISQGREPSFACGAAA